MTESDKQELLRMIHQLDVKLAKLPHEVSEMVEKKCITRAEFRSAKGAIGILAAVVSGAVSALAYFIGVHK